MSTHTQRKPEEEIFAFLTIEKGRKVSEGKSFRLLEKSSLSLCYFDHTAKKFGKQRNQQG